MSVPLCSRSSCDCMSQNRSAPSGDSPVIEKSFNKTERCIRCVKGLNQIAAFLSKKAVEFSLVLFFFLSSPPKAIKLQIDFCISARFLAPLSPSLAIDPHKAADSKVRGPILSGLRK